MLKVQRDTCKNRLEETLDRESMEEYEKFIMTKREARHLKTINQHSNKFERLCHKNKNTEGGHSNIKHGEHDEEVNNNTNNEDKKKDDSANYTTSNNNTWVRNISSTLLTEARVKLLNQGPNYAVAPRSPLIAEYIASIEHVCTILKQGEVDKLRGEVKAIMKKIQPPKYNLTKELKALEELKKDKNRMALTADKGVSIVVIDKEEYIRKVEELLRQPTYKPIPTDPTNKYKNKLISLLKNIKTEGHI